MIAYVSFIIWKIVQNKLSFQSPTSFYFSLSLCIIFTKLLGIYYLVFVSKVPLKPQCYIQLNLIASRFGIEILATYIQLIKSLDLFLIEYAAFCKGYLPFLLFSYLQSLVHL